MSVTREVNALLVGSDDEVTSVPMRIELWHHQADPLAVELVIYWEDEHLSTWCFARDLLVEAVATKLPTGRGDVQLRTGPGGSLLVRLTNPTGRADFKLPLNEVKGFLDDTVDDAQNLDALHLDIDEFLKDVLGG
jgi:sporulation and cell division protein SsgA